MPLSGFLLHLREKVGNDLLLLPSAAVAVFDERRRLLVGKHSDTNRWVLPGGLIEPGESPADGAVRECWEETGLLVELTGIFAVLGGPNLMIDYKNGDKAAYVTTVFRSRIIGGEYRADGIEILELRHMSQEELVAAPHSKWVDDVVSALFNPASPPYFQPPTWRP